MINRPYASSCIGVLFLKKFFYNLKFIKNKAKIANFSLKTYKKQEIFKKLKDFTLKKKGENYGKFNYGQNC